MLAAQRLMSTRRRVMKSMIKASIIANHHGKYQYTSAAIAGYLSGSFLTEIVGSFSLLGKGAGLPALVFLVPIMLMFVTFVSWRRGEMEEVWEPR